MRLSMMGAFVITLACVWAMSWTVAYARWRHERDREAASRLIAENRAKVRPGMAAVDYKLRDEKTKARRREETRALKQYVDDLHRDPVRLHRVS